MKQTCLTAYYLESKPEHLYPLSEDCLALHLQREALLLADGDQAGEHAALARAHVAAELAQVHRARAVQHRVRVDVRARALDDLRHVLHTRGPVLRQAAAFKQLLRCIT